ncbi:hypothetical protein THAOC_37693 [Thalassiosira oceanica]|uniref:Uncharacterized protein n=1 Tax=Thalassiosira oceanica TaxID=159749 RepID=K0QYI4_THAOC|nr:hypothetical protein THAOC_37693 [Thalassiosira oceanica]|eukprot:EJK43825.1 hypothetical protein THAOC_37693 [Thalassiosira oceanica]
MPDRFGKSRPGKGSGSGSKNSPQRSGIHADVHESGLILVTVLKETNGSTFTGDLLHGDVPALQDSSTAAHIVWCLHHEELLWTFLSFRPEYFGNEFIRQGVCREASIEAFEEDTGTEVGSAVAGKYEEMIYFCVTLSDTRAVFGALTGPICSTECTLLCVNGSIGLVRGLLPPQTTIAVRSEMRATQCDIETCLIFGEQIRGPFKKSVDS